MRNGSKLWWIWPVYLSSSVSDPVIIHRSHYTQLHTWGKADTPKCTIETGILIHMLWCCPKLRFYIQYLKHSMLCACSLIIPSKAIFVSISCPLIWNACGVAAVYIYSLYWRNIQLLNGLMRLFNSSLHKIKHRKCPKKIPGKSGLYGWPTICLSKWVESTDEFVIS